MVVGGRELIDTLWNVNLFARAKQMAQGKELIDTLWNVNDKLIAENTAQSATGINRYIMECK